MTKKTIFKVAKEYEECSEDSAQKINELEITLNNIINDCEEAYLKYNSEAGDLTFDVYKFNFQINEFEIIGNDVSQIRMLELTEDQNNFNPFGNPSAYYKIIPSDDACRFDQTIYNNSLNSLKYNLLNQSIIF